MNVIIAYFITLFHIIMQQNTQEHIIEVYYDLFWKRLVPFQTIGAYDRYLMMESVNFWNLCTQFVWFMRWVNSSLLTNTHYTTNARYKQHIVTCKENVMHSKIFKSYNLQTN